MSKKKNKSVGNVTTELFPEQEQEQELEARQVVVSASAPMFDVEKQDQIINEHENSGYEHYETTCPPHTGEVLFRFRLKVR